MILSVLLRAKGQHFQSDAACRSAKSTGLFLTFAHLSATPKAFLRFADRYGRLGTYHDYGPERGEPLDEWQLHHRWMRFLTHLRSASLNQEPILHRHVK